MSDKPELKPCPFCGKEAQVFENKQHDYFGIGCKTDRCHGEQDDDMAYFTSQEDAISSWNQRADLAKPSEPLYGKLTRIAATLLKARLSDFAEDYPKRFPKHVLRDIEKHNELLRRLACEIIDLRRSTP